MSNKCITQYVQLHHLSKCITPTLFSILQHPTLPAKHTMYSPMCPVAASFVLCFRKAVCDTDWSTLVTMVGGYSFTGPIECHCLIS